MLPDSQRQSDFDTIINEQLTSRHLPHAAAADAELIIADIDIYAPGKHPEDNVIDARVLRALLAARRQVDNARVEEGQAERFAVEKRGILDLASRELQPFGSVGDFCGD